MLKIDLSGKRAFVAGVGDDAGFGFAIAKHLAMAGASVCVGTWPPTYDDLHQADPAREDQRLAAAAGGRRARVRDASTPFDGDFDTLEDAPADMRENRRYKEHADFSIQGVADKFRKDFGDRPLDIVVHSFANGPEVKKPRSCTPAARATSRRSARARTRSCRWCSASGRCCARTARS